MRVRPSVLALALANLAGSALAAWTPSSDYTFADDWWHQAIKAKSAYDLNLFGKGVKVGIVDTGINLSSGEFSGRIGKCRSVSGGVVGSACGDDNGHGSHVAGIIGAAANGRGSMGIAPKASLLIYKALDGDGGGSLVDVDKAILTAANDGARIINGSLGYTGAAWSGDKTYLQGAVNKGALLVFAAGNDGAANPDWPARHATQAWAKGQILAVGAVDENNRIASFSNRAGDTRNFYLVAPGVDIVSTYMNSDYYYMSGTSMAAPMVSGAAALLMGYWPKLSAKDTANILLDTATDLGRKGVDSVYGHGLLNVKAALAPVGQLKTAASSGSRSVPVASSTLPASLAPAISSLAAAGRLDFAGLDAYQRNFTVATTDLLAPASEPSLDHRLQTLFAQPAVAGDESFQLAYGAGADALVSGVSAGAVPFLGFQDGDALFMSNRISATLKLGLFSSRPLDAVPVNGSQPGASGLSLNYGAGAWVINAGLVTEHEQFMGASQSGVLHFGDGREMFVSATRQASLAGRWQASATATLGLVEGGRGSGLVLGYSDMPVWGFSLNLDGRDLFAPHDRLGLSLSQSLKAIGGSATLELASYDQNQNATYSTRRVDLAGGEAEYVLALDYTRPAGKLGRAGLSLEYKANAAGLAGQESAHLTLGWNRRF
ncbi:MAG: S8 family peptidase [Pseudomonadota bacterium]